MNRTLRSFSRWTIRVAAALVLLIGLFWTWFGLACGWGDPPGMLMHTLMPGLPLVALGLACWRWPVAGGSGLALWGVSPLLLLVGSRPFFNYHGHWLSFTPLLVYWFPLLMGVLLIISATCLKRASRAKRN